MFISGMTHVAVKITEAAMLVPVDGGWGRTNNEHIFITYASARWVTRTAAAAESTATLDTPESRVTRIIWCY